MKKGNLVTAILDSKQNSAMAYDASMKRSILTFALFILTCFSVLAQPNNTVIATTGFTEIVKLPKLSHIYADTFAVYWRRPQELPGAGIASINFKYMTSHGDHTFEYDPSQDSIITLLFDEHYLSETGMILDWTMTVGDKKVHDYNQLAKSFKIIQKDTEVEAVKSLSRISYNFENVKMLADVYEKKECFANAYFTYSKLTSLDIDRGRKAFYEFLLRNSSQLNAPIRHVHR